MLAFLSLFLADASQFFSPRSAADLGPVDLRVLSQLLRKFRREAYLTFDCVAGLAHAAVSLLEE